MHGTVPIICVGLGEETIGENILLLSTLFQTDFLMREVSLLYLGSKASMYNVTKHYRVMSR